MALRLHSRLIVWNLLLITLVTFILSLFLGFSELALVVVIGVGFTFIFSYGVNVLISRPLHEISLVSRKLAAGSLDQRLPITGEEEIATLGTSLNTMAQTLSARMQALSDGKQQLELILEAMGQGVMVLARDGRITLTNSSLLKVLGTDRALVGKTPLEVFRRPELEIAVRKVLAEGVAQTLEITAANNRVLQANVSPVTNAARVVDSVVVVFHDLTEIRRAERMRRDFVANVSHEFKTPLTSIRGYTETLLTGAKDEPTIAVDFLNTIQRNAEHLETLVADLLTLARLEAEVPSSKDPINLRSMIDELFASRQNVIQERELRVTLDCSQTQVEADRSRLYTALSNLIDNAIHYNKQGGEIRVTAVVQNGALCVAVADTGQGIPLAELRRIFAGFYRLAKDTTQGW